MSLFDVVFVALLVGMCTIGGSAQSMEEERAVGSAYSLYDQKALLEQHNTYRSIVIPEATNMKEMVWDFGLAKQAQEWVDMCVYLHPDRRVHEYYNGVGQNLYVQTPDYTGSNPPSPVTTPVTAWYSELDYFYYEYDVCQPDNVCGHYTQLVWADTTRVGCGIKHCDKLSLAGGRELNFAWFVACNYSPPGNYRGESPYITGNYCSGCGSGIYCKNKLCTDCDPGVDGCECNIECANCGTRVSANCSCACPTGYHGDMCESYCENYHYYCGANPGWPPTWCNTTYWFVDDHCPLMCGHCTPGPPLARYC